MDAAYDDMDADYDDTDVYKHCVEKSIVFIIAINPRNKEKMAINPKVNTDEKGHFYCSKTNIRLVKNGTDKNSCVSFSMCINCQNY